MLKTALLIMIVLCASCARRLAAPVTPAGLNAAQNSWVDLHPQMQLRIENAYYRDGFPKDGIDGYLGTETAHYQVRSRGVRLLSVENLLNPQPSEQPQVQELLPDSQRHYIRYRYFYAVVFSHRGNIHGSVLLGAQSSEDLERLSTALMIDPDSVCEDASKHCTVFPEMCTASVDLEIVVNGVPRTVSLGSMLGSVVMGAHHVDVLRRNEDGHWASLKIEPNDPNALRVPLAAGDRIQWN
jgi:hypothetical protein